MIDSDVLLLARNKFKKAKIIQKISLQIGLKKITVLTEKCYNKF